MMLTVLIAIPLIGGAVAWGVGGRLRRSAWVALATCLVQLAAGVAIWLSRSDWSAFGESPQWEYEFHALWIPSLGIGFQLALDGLSLLMVLLTASVGVMAVAASWTEIGDRSGFYYLNLLSVLAGITGVFMAVDLFLFYFFWELMLVPMYFLIRMWGHEDRVAASLKFFIYTQAAGLVMFVAILGLVIAHQRATGVITFEYTALLNTPLSLSAQRWLLLGFFVGFTVKLAAVPLHTWLPDAHTQAPTGGSVILAGLLLKTGGYGLLRFAIPLFPEAAAELSGVFMALGAASIIYGALLAFAQTDMKRLIAYSSVSHMGFVLMGAFAMTGAARLGAVMQMLTHAAATGMLFLIAGAVQERVRTRELARMGGLWECAPRLGGVTLFMTLAALGLPGTGNFIAEFLVLLGSWPDWPVITVFAASGIVLSAVYGLSLVQRCLHGPNREGWRIADLSGREIAISLATIAALIWLGLFPGSVLRFLHPADREGRPRSNLEAPTNLHSNDANTTEGGGL